MNQSKVKAQYSSEQHRAQTPIDHILERLSPLELPAKEQFEHYLRHKSRLNHKRSTLDSSFTSIMLFLDFYGRSGKRDLKDLERCRPGSLHRARAGPGPQDLDGEDHGWPSSLRFSTSWSSRISSPGTALKKTIKLKLPDALPRAINPKDVRKAPLRDPQHPGPGPHPAPS